MSRSVVGAKDGGLSIAERDHGAFDTCRDIRAARSHMRPLCGTDREPASGTLSEEPMGAVVERVRAACVTARRVL